jgi:ATP-dependent Clp protease protease subunit
MESPAERRLQSREYVSRREMTLGERLADERILFLWGPIGEIMVVSGQEVLSNASLLVMRMLELQAKAPDRDIQVYINSPGGGVEDTLAIYDTMQFLSCDVQTYCVGLAASGAAIILAAGTKGKRYALPHSKIMIHQPRGGASGQATDIQIWAEELLRDRRLLHEILARHTGRSLELIEKETERDRWMMPEEALQYGIVDEILQGGKKRKKS